ncbi:hypothetical protein EAG21025_44020 (plasmid) [Enterobacter asburiae]|uniref:hypothetical protein n=1 Tax=Enterobacter asburiae TaxID=61645 RepID=UPI0034E8FC6E|nr:hypothetical protein [Enterobacter asburiae]
MNKHSKHMIAALFLTTSASALAAGTVSNTTSSTADIIFAAPVGPINVTITPVSGLVAGPLTQGKKLADISLTSTISQTYAYRFGPFNDKFVTDGTPIKAIASGRTNSDNKLAITINNRYGNPAAQTTMITGEVYQTLTNPLTSYTLELIPTVLSTVNADTYAVSVEAAVYTS